MSHCEHPLLAPNAHPRILLTYSKGQKRVPSELGLFRTWVRPDSEYQGTERRLRKAVAPPNPILQI